VTDEIRDGISRTIATAFPDCGVFGDERVRQGLEPPSFFVGLGACSSSPLPGGLISFKQHVEVVYFPERQGDYGELWSAGTRALALLEQIPLTDGTFVRGVARRCAVNDGLMHIHATYHLRLKPAAHIDLMGDLQRRVTWRE